MRMLNSRCGYSYVLVFRINVIFIAIENEVAPAFWEVLEGTEPQMWESERSTRLLSWGDWGAW